MTPSSGVVKVELRMGPTGPSVRIWAKDGPARTFVKCTGNKGESVQDMTLRALTDLGKDRESIE
jgi:hypothetical protein